MTDRLYRCFLVSLLAVALGCVAHEGKQLHRQDALASTSTRIEYPSFETSGLSDARETLPPLDPDTPPEFWDVSLQAVIQMALENSQVLRDMGGSVLDAPGSIRTIFDPAIQETDPQIGVNAALSEFDASLAASTFFEKNDRALNNIFEGGGTRLFRQDLGLYNLELKKPTAFGTEFTARNFIDYNYNNAPGNNVPNLPWVDRLELEFRQPLLQGAGVAVNRIAGRSGVPGVYNGVMIARMRTDVTLADFEAAVRDLVSNVENAYWELYFAYRDLDAAIDARGRARRTWTEVRALSLAGRSGGEAARLAQAEEQFFRLDAVVEDALRGHAIEETRTNLFQGHGGVHASERRLRVAMGIPVSDGRLLRPADQPPLAEVLFDWDQVVNESLQRRVELRRQRWHVQQRELETLAARNLALPRLDAVGGYRFRGLGHDLIDSDREGISRFDNAVANLTSGDFQEWQLGLDLTVPLGRRRAYTAVRNAELRLARERAILTEQERQIVGGLSDAIAETRRAYQLARKNFNRTKAAREQLAALDVDYERAAGAGDQARLLDLLLNAQLQAAEAESRFHRSLAEYMVGVKNVHYEKGTLLALNQIFLAEGPWPRAAYLDANTHAGARRVSPTLSNFVHRPLPAVSQGAYRQATDTTPLLSDQPGATSPSAADESAR